MQAKNTTYPNFTQPAIAVFEKYLEKQIENVFWDSDTLAEYTHEPII